MNQPDRAEQEQPCGWCKGEGAIMDPSGRLEADCPRCKGNTRLIAAGSPLLDPPAEQEQVPPHAITAAYERAVHTSDMAVILAAAYPAIRKEVLGEVREALKAEIKYVGSCRSESDRLRTEHPGFADLEIGRIGAFDHVLSRLAALRDTVTITLDREEIRQRIETEIDFYNDLLEQFPLCYDGGVGDRAAGVARMRIETRDRLVTLLADVEAALDTTSPEQSHVSSVLSDEERERLGRIAARIMGECSTARDEGQDEFDAEFLRKLAEHPSSSEAGECECEGTGIYEEGDEWAPCSECNLGRDFATYLRTAVAERDQWLREWLRSDEAVEIAADHLSPYVGMALADIRAEAPHILDLYRERARALLSALTDKASETKGGTDG